MRKLLSLEELAQFMICIYVLSQMSLSFNYFILIPAFFIPDFFAIGYLVNRKTGAMLYNFSHHKLVALCILSTGYYLKNEYWLVFGLLVYGHTCFDRTIGYGLKYIDSPNHTHLGFIGKEKYKNTKDHY